MTKELEYSLLQDEMGKELQELDKRLEQKEVWFLFSLYFNRNIINMND